MGSRSKTGRNYGFDGSIGESLKNFSILLDEPYFYKPRETTAFPPLGGKKNVKTRYFFHRGPRLIERISTNERAR